MMFRSHQNAERPGHPGHHGSGVSGTSAHSSPSCALLPWGRSADPGSETAMRDYGRAFHIIDIENLLALTHGQPVGAVSGALYKLIAGVEDRDLMMVSAEESRVFDLRVAFPGAEVRSGRGTDGADLALIDNADITHIAKRFDTVVIGSGDNRFIDVAYRSRQHGLNVVVFSRPRSLSRVLASYADVVIDMPALAFAA